MILEIHYNAFQTIKEQIPEGYEVKDIDYLEDLKVCILKLYINDILTESQEDKALRRLHKQVMKNLRRKEDTK